VCCLLVVLVWCAATHQATPTLLRSVRVRVQVHMRAVRHPILFEEALRASRGDKVGCCDHWSLMLLCGVLVLVLDRPAFFLFAFPSSSFCALSCHAPCPQVQQVDGITLGTFLSFLPLHTTSHEPFETFREPAQHTAVAPPLSEPATPVTNDTQRHRMDAVARKSACGLNCVMIIYSWLLGASRYANGAAGTCAARLRRCVIWHGTDCSVQRSLTGWLALVKTLNKSDRETDV
jgi:hypothetical protein